MHTNAAYLFLFFQYAFGQLMVTHNPGLGPQVCANLLNSVARFTEGDGGLMYFCKVDNQPALGSIAHCILDNFQSSVYLESFIKGCNGLTNEKVHAAYANASDRMLNGSSLRNMPLVFEPVELNGALVLDTFSRASNNAFTDNWTVYYGVAMTGYWFVILMIASVHHWTYWLFPNFIKSLHGTLSNKFRKHFVLAPTGSFTHAVPKRFVLEWMIPLRFETLSILGWTVLAVIFAATNTKPNPGFRLSTHCGRCAYLALWSLPALILFAGRNNILQGITGWPYSRFLLIHRWMARLVVALLFIHGVGESVTALNLMYFKNLVSESNMILAIMALAAGCLMLFQSLKWFRTKNYELFLLVHIVLAVLFIVGGWRHTRSQGTPQFHYAAVVIWVFDRVVRLTRLAAFGVRTAEIQLINDETLKVTVSRPCWWKPYPGSHAFIHFVKPVHFWQSHPFSFVDSVFREDTITFYIKVKNGITRSICDDLKGLPDKVGTCKVVAEGPYGCPVPVHKFDNTIFLAGGNGVPGIFQDVLELSKQHIESKRVVKLFWVIRDLASVKWFMDELMALDNTIVDVVIYVTSMTNELEPKIAGDKRCSNDNSSIIQRLSHVEIRPGRPNIQSIVFGESASAYESVAFSTCAHPAMVDEVRAAVRGVLEVDHSKRIELFEINQTW